MGGVGMGTRCRACQTPAERKQHAADRRKLLDRLAPLPSTANSNRRKPFVDVTPPAHEHSEPTERIVEVTFPSGRGCLISCRIRDDGAEEVVIYRADRGVRTWCDSRIRARKGRGQRGERS